ncbi:hypothetical protein [Bacillus cereus group sp. MYBK57-1]|uniref:hypothetical protein n=1 Tax=Bacillus cereus group sp. MYBK57-1 TaxID=3450619 RepID=UPI003F79510F
MADTCITQADELRKVTETLSDTINKKTEEIKNETNAEAEKINSEDPKGNTGLTFNIEVTWTDKPIKFHIPTVKFEDKHMAFDFPEVKMVDKDIIFHFPECHTEDQVVGKYPEIHGTKIVWKDIITSVPVCVNKEQRIVMGIPEVSMQRQDIIMGIPIIEMQEVEINIKYPEFKLVNVTVEMQEKSDELQKDTKEKLHNSLNEVKSNTLEEFKTKHTNLFECLRSEFLSKRQAALTTIDGMITGMNTAIQQMKGQNVPADNEALKQTEANLQGLVAKRNEMDTEFVKNQDELNNQQKTSLEQFINQFDLKVE